MAKLATNREHESGPPRTWDTGEIAQEISRILGKKNSKAFKGGPYSERVLCIFTGEPRITAADIEREIQLLQIRPLQQLTSAYVLLPFDPQLGLSPHAQIHLIA